VQILELLVEDNQLNVYAGEPEARPPGAATSGLAVFANGWLSDVRRGASKEIVGVDHILLRRNIRRLSFVRLCGVLKGPVCRYAASEEKSTY
jgi:hypothetical protein